MNDHDELRERILSRLRSRGVNTSELIVIVRASYVLVGGQVSSFYEHQLIQQFANRCQHEIAIEIDVTVATHALRINSCSASERSSAELHQLRNRLNRLVLGLGLVKHALSTNNLELSQQIIDDLLANEAPGTQPNKRPLQERLVHKSILVVEDDLNQCLLLSGLLRQLGARVTQRRTAESARSWIQNGNFPDVMLIDLHLTGEQGERFAQWFRHVHADNHTVLIAVSADRPSLAAHEPDPFAQWLPKPINIDRLIATILTAED